MALSVPWPFPVRANEPYNSVFKNDVYKGERRFFYFKSLRKAFAAFIGPTVWELEGPIPILSNSKALIDITIIKYIII